MCKIFFIARSYNVFVGRDKTIDVIKYQSFKEEMIMMNSIKNKVMMFVVLAVLVVVGGAGIKIYINYRAKMAALESLYGNALEDIDELKEVNKKMEEEKNVKVSVYTLKEYTSASSDLITQNYFYTDIGEYEKTQKFGDSDVSIPFTTDKIVYSVSGKISAGINMSDIRFEVQEAPKKKIIVYMPVTQIIAHQIDENSFKSYDVKNSVFTSSDMQDYAKLQGKVKDEQEKKILENSDFWNDTKKNAEDSVYRLITVDENVTQYDIKFNWASQNE